MKIFLVVNSDTNKCSDNSCFLIVNSNKSIKTESGSLLI